MSRKDLSENKVSSLKDFVYFDDLYAKHQELKKRYLELYDCKFSDFTSTLNEITHKSEECEQKSKKLIDTLQLEVKRWQGDCKFTSKELAEKLKDKGDQYQNTLKALEDTRTALAEKEKVIVEKNKELEIAMARIASIKGEIELRYKNEMHMLENHMIAQTKSLKKEIRLLKIKIDSVNEEKDQKTKTFRGFLAENESKWATEKVEMQQKIREILDEVAHWNKEALKMENRVRHYEKKLIAAGFGLEYDRADAEAKESQYDALIRERNRLKADLDDARRKLETRVPERDAKKRKLSSADSFVVKDVLAVQSKLDCFALMSGINIENLKAPDLPGDGLNGQTKRYICKVLNYGHTNMIEFELHFDLDKNQAQYIPKRVIDEDEKIENEFKNSSVIKLEEMPNFLSQLLANVNRKK